MYTGIVCPNEPYGAWCFLTHDDHHCSIDHVRLNAPFGAWCFLTKYLALINKARADLGS